MASKQRNASAVQADLDEACVDRTRADAWANYALTFQRVAVGTAVTILAIKLANVLSALVAVA